MADSPIENNLTAEDTLTVQSVVNKLKNLDADDRTISSILAQIDNNWGQDSTAVDKKRLLYGMLSDEFGLDLGMPEYIPEDSLHTAGKEVEYSPEYKATLMNEGLVLNNNITEMRNDPEFQEYLRWKNIQSEIIKLEDHSWGVVDEAVSTIIEAHPEGMSLLIPGPNGEVSPRGLKKVAKAILGADNTYLKSKDNLYNIVTEYAGEEYATAVADLVMKYQGAQPNSEQEFPTLSLQAVIDNWPAKISASEQIEIIENTEQHWNNMQKEGPLAGSFSQYMPGPIKDMMNYFKKGDEGHMVYNMAGVMEVLFRHNESKDIIMESFNIMKAEENRVLDKFRDDWDFYSSKAKEYYWGESPYGDNPFKDYEGDWSTYDLGRIVRNVGYGGIPISGLPIEERATGFAGAYEKMLKDLNLNASKQNTISPEGE